MNKFTLPNQNSKILILGSGPAGYTAAIYAARANLEPILITGINQGGQLMTTTNVENWPGDANGVQGPELMERFLRHTKNFNVNIFFDHINKVQLDTKPFLLFGDNIKYTCDSLIIATGATAKYLGLPSELAFLGKGVSLCATCDGYFYKNKIIAVVGGGNTAVQEALFLSNIAKQVIVIHRRDKFKAEPILINRLLNKEKEGKIKIYYNKYVIEIVGDNSGVTGMYIQTTNTSVIELITVHGVFIAIGHKPNTELFAKQIDLENDYIITGQNSKQYMTMTNIPGVFAAGDAQDSIYRQAITSAATGCMAALDAQKFLECL